MATNLAYSVFCTEKYIKVNRAKMFKHRQLQTVRECEGEKISLKKKLKSTQHKFNHKILSFLHEV